MSYLQYSPPELSAIILQTLRAYAEAYLGETVDRAVVTVPEFSVKWWQDYLTILTAVASLVTAYTGLYFIFNGNSGN